MSTVRDSLRGSTGPLIEAYDTLLFDLDGVVYVGAEAVPGAPERLADLRSAGHRVAYVTNNAARRPDTVAAQLTRLGIDAGPEDIVTSAQAAARLVADQVPAGSPVLVVGGEGLVTALEESGLRPVFASADAPAAVVQGFHPDVGWRLLAEGAYALARDVPWVASNVDRTLPTDDGLAPGNGTLVEVLRMVTGREPVVAGKPGRPLLDEAIRRTGGTRALVIGDRLDTDIEGAYNAGLPSLLVLTGVTTVDDLLSAPPEQRPTYLSSDLGGLFVPHDAPDARADGASCGGWAARLVDGAATLDGGGDRDDAIRALAAACWDTTGPVDTAAAVRALV